MTVQEFAIKYAGQTIKLIDSSESPGHFSNGRLVGHNGRGYLVLEFGDSGWNPSYDPDVVFVVDRETVKSGWNVRFNNVINPENEVTLDLSKWPHKCNRCKGPACVMFSTVDCMAKCA